MPKAKKKVVTNKEAYDTIDRLRASLEKLIDIEKKMMTVDGAFIVVSTILVLANLYVHTIPNLILAIALAAITVLLTVPSFLQNREEIRAQRWFIKNFLDEDGSEHKHFLSHIKGEKCKMVTDPEADRAMLEAIGSIIGR